MKFLPFCHGLGTEDGAFLLPLGFTCNPIWVNEAPVDEFGLSPEDYESSTSTPLPESWLLDGMSLVLLQNICWQSWTSYWYECDLVAY